MISAKQLTTMFIAITRTNQLDQFGADISFEDNETRTMKANFDARLTLEGETEFSIVEVLPGKQSPYHRDVVKDARFEFGRQGDMHLVIEGANGKMIIS
jgi:hypothetical protein